MLKPKQHCFKQMLLCKCKWVNRINMFTPTLTPWSHPNPPPQNPSLLITSHPSAPYPIALYFIPLYPTPPILFHSTDPSPSFHYTSSHAIPSTPPTHPSIHLIPPCPPTPPSLPPSHLAFWVLGIFTRFDFNVLENTWEFNCGVTWRNKFKWDVSNSNQNVIVPRVDF